MKVRATARVVLNIAVLFDVTDEEVAEGAKGELEGEELYMDRADQLPWETILPAVGAAVGAGSVLEVDADGLEVEITDADEYFPEDSSDAT